MAVAATGLRNCCSQTANPVAATPVILHTKGLCAAWSAVQHELSLLVMWGIVHPALSMLAPPWCAASQGPKACKAVMCIGVLHCRSGLSSAALAPVFLLTPAGVAAAPSPAVWCRRCLCASSLHTCYAGAGPHQQVLRPKPQRPLPAANSGRMAQTQRKKQPPRSPTQLLAAAARLAWLRIRQRWLQQH